MISSSVFQSSDLVPILKSLVRVLERTFEGFETPSIDLTAEEIAHLEQLGCFPSFPPLRGRGKFALDTDKVPILPS